MAEQSGDTEDPKQTQQGHDRSEVSEDIRETTSASYHGFMALVALVNYVPGVPARGCSVHGWRETEPCDPLIVEATEPQTGRAMGSFSIWIVESWNLLPSFAI